MADIIDVKLDAKPIPQYARLGTTLTNSKTAQSNNALFQTVNGLIGSAKTLSDFVNNSFDTITLGFGAINNSLNTIFSAIEDVVNTFLDRNSSIYGVSSYGSSPDNVPTSFGQQLTLNADSFGSLRSGNYLVVPPGGFGQYLVSGNVTFEFNATGYRQVTITVNGAIDYTIAKLHGGLTDSMIIPFSLLLALGDGNTVSVFAYQTSGVTLQIQASLSMVRISYV